VKRALAVIWSGFVYDMDLITEGFITDPDRMNEENEVACLGLIEVAEEPGVASQSSSRSRWFRLPMTRACELNLGMKAWVIS
jgi:hypothetical protein